MTVLDAPNIGVEMVMARIDFAQRRHAGGLQRICEFFRLTGQRP